MNFQSISRLICCALASVWTASCAAHWVKWDFFEGDTTEDFNSPGKPEAALRLGFWLSPLGEENPLQCPSCSSLERYPSRRHNVAFHPVQFDDMFSIDKRGNTLHFVDDQNSVAKSAYPLWPGFSLVLRSALGLVKLALSTVHIQMKGH